MSIIEEIAAERERQKSAEGWTPEHDNAHIDGELARAASCYAAGNDMPRRWHKFAGDTRRPAVSVKVPLLWPWSPKWWKPKERRRDLIRAAALIVAEIERLDRASKRPQ